MENYPSNSKKSKSTKEENDRNITKVVSGKVSTKKDSGAKKIIDIFLSEDVTDVKNYIIWDVLVPAAKKTILETVNAFLYGDKGSYKNDSKISYGRYYDREKDRRETTNSRIRRSYENIVIENRGEAEEVLDRMYDILETYDVVRVADLFDLVGMSCEYTDNKYGWKDLKGSGIKSVRDGYILKLPRALPLD